MVADCPGDEPRVLVVDDDATTRRMLEKIMTTIGVRAETAGDGAEGLRRAAEHPPDLVLLDVNLPDTDGYAVCSQLKQHRMTSTTPVLFISGNDDIQAKVRGFDAGGVDYITKPLAGAEVIARVRTHLRLKRAYDTVERLQSERMARLETSQRMIFPLPLSIPAANFAVRMTQLWGAGGDFYDVIPVGGDVFDYIVADASGHDVGTALWTTMLKTLVREYASPVEMPVDILRRVNGSLCRILPDEQFFTVAYARLNRRAGSLSVVTAGHPPVHCCRRGKAPLPLGMAGDVVGSFADAEFSAQEVPFSKGDRFYLHTDGLVEVDGASDRATDRLLEAVTRSGGDALEAAMDAILAFTVGDRQATDDVLLMGVEG
jgi:phosphoserine phosphatase RsbU/P